VPKGYSTSLRDDPLALSANQLPVEISGALALHFLQLSWAWRCCGRSFG
jgi:hypothetical protein